MKHEEKGCKEENKNEIFTFISQLENFTWICFLYKLCLPSIWSDLFCIWNESMDLCAFNKLMRKLNLMEEKQAF